MHVRDALRLSNYFRLSQKKKFKKRKSPIGKLGNCCIFVSVFHRILDFKNGAGFLSGPHFF
jgi:hypothetical protein